MPDLENIFEVYLRPGEFYWGDETTRIRTILGSCVAISLWHPYKKVGGLSHSMLTKQYQHTIPDKHLPAKFIDSTILLFLDQIKKEATKPHEYIVKLFGGSQLFSENDTFNIGTRNIEFARSTIVDAGFKIHSEHTGGTTARNIILDIWDGQTWLREVKNSKLNE